MDRATFVVHINSSRHMPDRVRMAAQLAASTGAHLVGVASTLMDESPYMNCVGSEAASVLSAYLECVREKAAADLDVFESIARSNGVGSTEKRIIEADPGMALCLQGRYSDLLIVGQVDPDDPLDEPRNLPEYVLVNAGRPMVICPNSTRPETIGTRCVVAWDGSTEASRAISGAMPFLRNAGQVLLNVIDPKIGEGAHGQEPGADMALYLARHGIRLEVAMIRTGEQIDIGEALLAQAARFGADLLVMGGYGHSRFREIVLGGVTATVFRSMTCPVLMAH
ncbi:universal stress protein [Noviherbaspirillum sp.]|uniref:universal stress protein n=1 Tax=Noviherbaspirillum sp. TaxID=1926288 RepID=UPI002B483173|nr:universal stress protein [Noviherbaspirillum sp.]HJV81863.1 universal stress protein [Noviherbaspirillum sp.]